jgi:hypothetical protein
MITRGQIMNEIWTRLSKTAATPGFYTALKVQSVIQESVDFLAAEQILADEGYCHKLDYLAPAPGATAIAIPADVAQVLELRYLVGNVYIPMKYDQAWQEARWAGSSGVVQSPDHYSIVDNNFYFSPPIGVGGLNYLQLEYMAYPRRFRLDSDVLPTQFDRAMFWFIVYNSCSLLDTQVSQSLNWDKTAQMWYQKAINTINMRTRQSIPIKNFEG